MTISMKLPIESDKAAPQGPVPTIFEAIVRKRCVVATYNRVTMTLAPHVIYTKHGDLFIDAVAHRKGRQAAARGKDRHVQARRAQRAEADRARIPREHAVPRQ